MNPKYFFTKKSNNGISAKKLIWKFKDGTFTLIEQYTFIYVRIYSFKCFSECFHGI